MPVLWDSSPPPAGAPVLLRSIFCQRRADSALIRVVRFSRLIGNLDTTDSEATAQVGPLCRRYKRNREPTPRCSWWIRPSGLTLNRSKRTKRHYFEWRFASLRWSLASQQIMGGGYFHRAFYRLSRPVFRFFGGLLLPSVCCFCGLAGIFPAAGTSLAPPR